MGYRIPPGVLFVNGGEFTRLPKSINPISSPDSTSQKRIVPSLLPDQACVPLRFSAAQVIASVCP